MQTTSFTEFRKHATHYFDAVEKGETVSIVRHGKLIAKIVPAQSEEKAMASWKKPALKLTLPDVVLGEAILADRASSKT